MNYSFVSEYGPGIVDWGSNVKYGGTFRDIDVWGQLTFSLNPLTADGQHLGITPEMYEGLFYVNPLNGAVTSLLGSSYKWENKNLKLVVTTRKNVKWSDGTSFTAQDVAFTFNLLKTYPSLDLSGLWSPNSGLQSVEASDDNTVVFEFVKPDTPLFFYIASQPIVPEHIWSAVKDPVTFTNPNPVGTGPFLFKSFSANTNTIVAVKNPNYWMKGRPYINEIEVKSVSSATPFIMAMLKHDEDFNYGYIPNVQQTWADKDPSVNKYWWAVSGENILYLNTLKYPFDNSTFRKALSIAINKVALEERAYFGIGGVANPAAIIPSQMNEWFDPTLTALASELNTYNPNKAQELLASIGFKKDSNGQLLAPDGKPLPIFKILVGAGWTDYITQAQIISEDLKTLGISTTIDQETWGSYLPSLMSGTYDMAICWGSGGGPTPYYLYYQEFNPTFSASTIGKTAISDYSRYTNPLVTASLDIYSETSDTRLQKQAIYTIERIMLEDVPFIPLTYRTTFDNYSEETFTGFPSALYPYNGGENIDGQGGEMLILNVHLK
ncbi:MAG: ABC transporter substrate-binding protein [Thermotogae bacterium]|nr:ABC transporter substrate-binding protein [Thermotogota bacterium]